MTLNKPLQSYCNQPNDLVVTGCPEGYDSLSIAQCAQAGNAVLVMARDANRAFGFEREIRFFYPEAHIILIPSWDCLPYDRISPSESISARRLWALSQLQALDNKSTIVIASVETFTQKVPPRQILKENKLILEVGQVYSMDTIEKTLIQGGYRRVSTVSERGEFAVRGGVIDVFSPACPDPIRLDFFGDHLETLRSFDPESQRSLRQITQSQIIGVSEIILNPERISRFRSGFIEVFGNPGDNAIYSGISEGQIRQGAHHFLPLIYERLETLFDYVPDTAILHIDDKADLIFEQRLDVISDLFQSRLDASRTAGRVGPYLSPDRLYLNRNEWQLGLSLFRKRQIQNRGNGSNALDMGGRVAKDFITERKFDSSNLFNLLSEYTKLKSKESKRVLLASQSEGASDRLGHMLADHGGPVTRLAPSFSESLQFGVAGTRTKPVQRIVLALDHGFETDDLLILSETDILGERLLSATRRKQAKNFLTEATALTRGDLVVHIEHGVGRFEGIQTLSVNEAPHDCLELQYAADSKLFLPVENIDLLSRYGGDSEDVALDRLGSANWQARKARTKARLREMAEGLIKLAAERALKDGACIEPPAGLFDEFCAQFPYEETDDQLNAILDVVEDLHKGQPMDRLICGDVGFGKTEVALRAAFIAAMSGQQVAIICPTTLLARQHFRTFSERFRGWPIRLAHLSRMVGAGAREEARQGLMRGEIEVVIGTHALLSDKVKFSNLGLVIVDEEHHFGVKHKEALKALRKDVHVLALSATPIPRTLQMALTGIRDMSIIATPPVDRLAIRTVVMPFDAVGLREALLREKYRGGQAYYIVPRISDLSFVSDFLRDHVPEVKFVIGHGQLSPTALEDVMNAFYEGQYDVLVSTTIVESGLDVPSANTLIVHRADMFGLAQLYQIRGRVGRSKNRAYAFLTHKGHVLSDAAEKRLNILQSLDNLGAGFQLASHDLDIRGGGNLLGHEQSGHIREVGVELYQQMLEEAVSELKHSPDNLSDQRGWSPQINAGAAVLIPDTYIPDLNIRLALYRRVSEAEMPEEREALAAELIDRFGPIPDETQALLKVVAIKAWCRTANIAKLDLGPKGAVISFRQDRFDNPGALIGHIQSNAALWRLRPDQKLVVKGEWPDSHARLIWGERIAQSLARLVSPDSSKKTT